MQALRCWPTVLLLVSAAAAPGLSAQVIDGVLLERGTDRPIDLGLVTLLTVGGDSVDAVLTDSTGHFMVTSPDPGEFLLAAGALGYRTTVAGSVLMLGTDSRMSLQFRIEPIAIEIGGITIEAKASLANEPRLVRSGFVDRARQGQGRFITPGEIAESAALSTSDLLARTGRVMTRYGLGGDRILMRSPRGYCSPVVYMDGVQVPLEGFPIDAVAPVSMLEAVEVYRSANEAPIRYRGGGMGGCGVIVIWTRAR